MLFTRAGYEQSSSEAIARHRAARLADALGRGATARLADLCGGIGGDLVARAGVGEVLAVDRDAVHARLARYNAGVYDEADRVAAVVADVRDVPRSCLAALFPDISTSLVSQVEPAGFIPLNAIVLKACQPNPANRYATAAEMHQALLALQDKLDQP